MKKRLITLWRPIVLIVFITALFVVASASNLGDRFEEFRGWIRSLGAWGPIIFILIYSAGVVAALPRSLLTIAAGLLFGAILGTIVVSIAATIGASIAFLISRYFAKESISHLLEKKETFRKINNLTETKGSIIVFITRLVPIFPFNTLNYGFGLTKVGFWTYAFWSWLGMLPIIVIYVLGVNAAFSSIQMNKIPWLLIFILIAIVILLLIAMHYVRNQLRREKNDVID